MAGFRRAQPEQATINAAIYGAAGSGKTFTTLLIAEGIANLTGKRIAYVDTERGSDFYAMEVAERRVHPQAFEFDAIYTRSITTISKEVKALSPDDYSVVVIDSMTHLWEAARNSYTGKTGAGGQIPLYAWQGIKKPYKDLETWLLNSPFHVFFLGRQGVDYQDDEDTGETKAVGTKMKAEGETPYEPNLLIHMEARKHGKRKEPTITAFAEKDRSGILTGKLITWPDFNKIAKPLLEVMGVAQAQLPTIDETRVEDVESLAEADTEKARRSEELRDDYLAQFQLAKTVDAVEKVSKSLTKEIKTQLVSSDLTALREAYRAAVKKAERREKSELETEPEPEKAEEPV